MEQKEPNPQFPLSAYSAEFTVDESMIDRNHHVNNVVLVQWMQNVSTQHASFLGGMKMMDDWGCAMVVRTHDIDFKAQAFLGDVIRCTTWVNEFGKASSVRCYKFVRPSDNKEILYAETSWAFLDLKTGTPTRIPQEFKALFGME